MINGRLRHNILAAAIIIVFLVLAIRLFSVQLLNKEYRLSAENNA